MSRVTDWTPHTDAFKVSDEGNAASHAQIVEEGFGEPTNWLLELLERLETLKNLKQNWDGENGLPVIDGCADEAVAILVKASERHTPKPHISPTPDGGISFEISNAGRELGLDIEHDLTLGILRKDVDGKYTEKEAAHDLMQMMARRELLWLMSGS